MEEFKGPRWWFYNMSNTGQALFDTLFMAFYASFLLPPAEKISEGMIQFISDKTFFGVLTILGLLMIFGRLVDAFADPLIASLSDRSTSKFGRRRVFLMAGGFPLAFFTVMIFFPPVGSTSIFNAIYLAIIFGLFFFFYTIYVAPYLALIPELGHTEKQRLNITTVQGYFALLGGGIALIGGPLLYDMLKKPFGPVGAFQIMAVIMGGIGVLFLYLAVFAVDEKRFSDAKPSTIPFWESVKITLNNKIFLIFLITNMTFWFIFNTVRSSVIHITLTLLKGTEGDASLYNTLFFAGSGLFFIINWFLSKKLNKKTLMLLGLGSFACVSLLLSLTGLAIIPIDPKVWGLTLFALCGFPVAIFLVLPNVFVSEICDVDFKKTGERREGMYFGVHGFFVKVTLGLSAAALAFFYSAFGKDITNPLGVRLTIVAAAVVVLIGLIVFLRYPVLNEEKKTPVSSA
ncbi:MAG: MFS transporter [Spirochaetales bacterium]|nr:MFS transporter [Spirochaetales bacterium]